MSRNTTFSDTVSAYRCACIHRDQGSATIYDTRARAHMLAVYPPTGSGISRAYQLESALLR